MSFLVTNFEYRETKIWLQRDDAHIGNRASVGEEGVKEINQKFDRTVWGGGEIVQVS